MRRLLSVSVLAASLCAAAPAATAAPITFEVQGTVDQLTADPVDPFAGAVAFGTSFSGQYTFDPDAPDLIADGAGGTDGSYASIGATYGISVDFAGDSFGAFTLDGVAVNVRNGAPDQYGAFGFDGTLQISFLLESSSGDPFSDDLLPVVAPALADFDSLVFTFRTDDLDGNMVEVLGRISSLTSRAAPVPEPGALLLLALGGAATVSRWRARG